MVTQLVANSCDTILGTMWGGGFISFVKQATPFGLFKNKKLVWGSNMGEHAVAVSLKSDFPEGMWAAAADLWYVEGSEAHKKYLAALAKLQGKKETGMWPITGYNAVYFAKAAIEKAGSTEPAGVAAALNGLTIQSPLGELTIDPKTHRANSPEFYGQVVTVPGSEAKRMINARLVR
jgi:branched-chain amino acid transport system substrate-binding protein